ncbi:MAG: class I SAM-dependent methyltransferase [Methanobacterium sp.]|nr:class I SAM-dependent methyltransferase [Methanobacterium sp.]
MFKSDNKKIWFLGRSYQEYMNMFSLKKDELDHMCILDCAGGASSFTPYLLNNGYDCTAVDMLYGKSVEEIKDQCINDFHTLLEVHSGMDHKVDWDFFSDPEDLVQQRITVYEEFIDSYAQYKGERYIQGVLPNLPLEDNSFNLVLSSHLLFLYEDRLGYGFHQDSLKEMLRVAADEVRIYPVSKLHGDSRSKFLPVLMDELSDDTDFVMERVDYHFRKGSNEMLRIIKK